MKKGFKSQASSGRVGNGFGGFGVSAFGSSQSSVLSYIQEPLDYSGISDANVVVAFKNLSKKDATTKAKALEDLSATIAGSDFEIEDGLLEAWVKLFPRLSIDSSRRVRQLAHTLNGQICSKSGKRTAKHMARIAGPWLAGAYDGDRAAAKAAQESLNVVFTDPKKLHGVRKAFQQAILEYCSEALLHETVQTLSDERTVSADDAQATFARVMATSLSLVNSLLDDLTADDIAPQQKLYEQLIEGKIWEYAVHSDTGVRRSMHRLVRAYLSKQPENLASHLKAASTAYIYKGLPSDQTGSSLDFMHTLDQLTGAHPNLWTEYYSGKKSAVSRLRSCLKHGSQAGPEQYWTALGSLVRKLPEEVLPTTYDEVADLLSGARDGASKREDRFNASHSWQTYATIADTSSRLLSEQDQDKLMENRVLPIVKQYLQPSPDTSDWGISGARGAWIVSKVAQIHRLPTILERELPSLADQLIEQVKISQPEQSKDYEKSQKEAASAGERWSALQREILNGGYDTPDSLRAVFVSQDTRIIKECLTLLKTRTGKPYGAAAVVDELLRVSGELLLDDAELKPTLASFAENDLPDLLFTPSQRHLTHCLYALESDGSFEKVFSAVLQRLVKDEAEPSSKERLLKVLFTRQTLEEATRIAQHSSDFQKLLASLTAPDEHGKVPFPGLLADMLCVGVVHSDTASSIVGSLTKQLAEEGTASDALQSLDYLASSSTAAGSQYLADPTAGGNTLLSNVIRLEQSQDDKVAELASKLSSKLSLSSGSNGSLDKFSIVRQNLDTISGSSIPIDTLHALVGRLAGSNGKLEDGAKAIPQLDNWWSALQSAMAPPSPSLSLLSPYGGAVYLVSGDKEPEFNTPHDAQGLSQALRVAMYIVRLLASTDVLVHLRNPTNEGDDTLSTIVALLVTTVVVAEDNMSIPRTNALWQPNAELDGEVLDFISEANAGITKVLADSSSSDSVAYQASFDRLLGHSSKAQSSATYYAALASSRLSSNLFETHGSSAESAKAGEDTIRGLRKSSDLFGLLRQLVGYAHPLSGSQYLNRVCNELVADLTGLDVAKSEERALRELVTLNVILNSQEDIVEAIAKQRLIFLVKHVIPWLEAGVDPAIKAEVAKALTALLPSMQDIYGEHWAQILTLVSQSWSALDAESIGETSIPLEYATLRLHGALRKLAKSQDANDDLVDALKDQDEQISEGLLNLLKATNGVSDESHQPLMLMNELLARQLTQLPARKLKHVDQLYSLLYTSSHAIQQAAFDLLHSQVPAGQEQISFDAALENKTAQLPDELLSLILDAPTLDSLAEASFDRSMPLSLQGYLYSWRLLFDHFNGSSYKVKSDYVEQLKDGTYLSGLLSLTFDFLGHTRGKSVDASRFNVADYQPNVEESPERDVQWLLTHLFYLSLTHLPSLTKSYYLDIRSRQTSLAVESWAAKFISPPIISASLQAVSEWSEKSVNEDPEYEKMTVKVGMRSKEINVSYVVDEQIMAIKVVLPEAYPLESAKVVGVSRVAVKEEKWQSWLRNCQGVITFSNGSITDGLSAWRKNVTGALKGQTECAICYSIISGDKQLPTKRCPTCKNLFHASCLYKWFRTSNASTCPLCRNAFNFN